MSTNPSSSRPGTFTLLLFAAAQTYAGTSSLSLPAPMPLSQLFPALEARFAGITQKVLGSCAVSLNLEYVDVPEEGSKDDTVIQVGDEVGIIPPVSSG